MSLKRKARQNDEPPDEPPILKFLATHNLESIKTEPIDSKSSDDTTIKLSNENGY